MQKLRFSKYTKLTIVLLDLLVLLAVFWTFFELNPLEESSWQSWEKFSLYGFFFSGIWFLLSGHTKLYDIPRNLTYTLFLERILTHSFLFIVSVYLFWRLTASPYIGTSKVYIALSFFVTFVLVKSLIFFSLKYIRQFGINHRNVMFLGAKSEAMQILKNTLQIRKDYGYQIHEYPYEKVEIDTLLSFWRKEGIFTVFLPLHDSEISSELREKIFNEAANSRVNIHLVPEVDSTDFFKFDISYLETLPVLTTSPFPLDNYANFLIKRFVDVVVSLLVLIFIGSWLFPIIALLIVVDSRGPVFFVQKRYGQNNVVFPCIKFRTMVINSHSSTAITRKNDDRITAIGGFLRQTSLDEMPQFLNVLLGQMSIVGPRPHMLKVDDYYRKKIRQYGFRSTVSPGITGLAQVNGLRGDKSADMKLEMKKRILADSFYIKNWSLAMDIVIMLKTVFIILKGDKNAG